MSEELKALEVAMGKLASAIEQVDVAAAYCADLYEVRENLVDQMGHLSARYDELTTEAAA